MNENTGNSGNDFFYDLLGNPADLSHSNAFNLQLLINDFPQSGLLRSMLAVKGEEENLQSASAYVNPKLLYKIATAVGSLPTVSNEQIVVSEKPHQSKPVLPLPGGVELPNLAIDETNYFHVPIDPDVIYTSDETEDIAPVEENADDIEKNLNSEVSEERIIQGTEDDAQIKEEKEEDVVVAEIDSETQPDMEAISPSAFDSEATDESEMELETEAAPLSEIDREVADEAEAQADAEAALDTDSEVTDESGTETATPPSVTEEPADVSEPVVSAETETEEVDYKPVVDAGDSNLHDKPIRTDQEIDDEVFEEIVSIEDIGLEQLAIISKVTDESEAEEDITTNVQETEDAPAGDSYFVFEPTLPEDEEHHAPAILTQNTAGSKGRQHVSRYNDEKMPYSFMWWLDKTRKEHASIYQPFAAEGKFHTETVNPVEKPQPAADHLQQQYVENIFAVSAAVSDLNVTPPKVDASPVETKADKIIEKFIHEEPQIKHPSKVKLDSENKAKKSSEDRDELVTETLAKIYTEQMLYHKAILTYKKLMLKFPEKSLYFAGQIEQLENKIN